MTIDPDYKFEVSLSTDTYKNKEISNAMIGSSKEEKVKTIRKKYGYSANKGVGYIRTTVTVQNLYEQLISGKVMCHLFAPKRYRKDGTFGSTEKNDENFVGSYTIGVDIDTTSYRSIDDYIARLKLKPSFFYTSHSNSIEHLKFRLIYVFDTLITNNYYFRYCSWKLHHIIEEDTNEIIEDKCGYRCAQYFNGTNQSNSVGYFKGCCNHIIYSLDDIGVSDDEYLDFLYHNCYYTSKKRKRTEQIKQIINSLTSNKATTCFSDSQTKTAIAEELIYNIDHLDYDEFMRFFRHKFKYVYRTEKDEWIDDIYQLVNDDYIQLFYRKDKIKHNPGKSHRRKKVFERMCLRRLIDPDITPDEIVFCAYEDVHLFFDNSDKVFNGEYYRVNCEYCFDLTLDEIRRIYSENIKKCMPKSGIIFKKGIDVAKRNCYLKQIKKTLVSENYDSNLSFKQNLTKVNRITCISARTLRDYYKELGIKVDQCKITEQELKELLDLSISSAANWRLLKEQGIKIGKERVDKKYKEMVMQVRNQGGAIVKR